VPKLEIRLLGPPRIHGCDQAPPIRRRKALALAAYLSTTRTPHTRDSLAAMFWPDAGREDALAQLRNHIWILRKAGLDPWLSIEGEMVELRPGEGLWVDVQEHGRLLTVAGLAPGHGAVLSARAESVLSEAVGIYQAHFLAGFSLPDSFAFEEWQLREEEALRVAQGSALDALIRLREEHGDLEGALASARLRVKLDPLDEQALRALMTLFARMGRRGEALQSYERFKRLIGRELEIPPDRETVLLRSEILARGPDEARPHPAPVATPRCVLPEPPTPFVGREQELEAIERFLEEPELRILTLTGPGGCGKTRLAIEAGRRLSRMFPEGVVFASLVSVEAGHLLPSVLAEAMSLPLGTRHRAPERRSAAASGSSGELIDCLRGKRMLLILDNLEQIAGELGPLREILAGARRCVVLATSRSRLHLAGEQVLEVNGLPWPSHKAPPDEMSRCASVRLFLQALRRTRSSSSPSHAELVAAADISRRLQGHPLGLELAASWTHSLSVMDIAAQLTRSLDLEAAPRTDIPARHRSLRVVFEHSWALLSSDERTAFRRLSLLAGAFDREAALEVGRTTPATFAALIEQSFLRRTRDQRLEILETLRQFGRQKLSENAREEAAAGDRASRHYLGKLIASRPALEGAGQRKALRDLARSRQNLRQAWKRAAERGWIAEMLKALRPLFLFYDMSSRAVEGAETLGVALPHLTDRLESLGRAAGRSHADGRRAGALRLLSLSLVAQAWFLRYENPARSRKLARQARRDLRDVGTPVERAFTGIVAGLLLPASARTVRELRDGALHCERAGDLWCTGLAWEVLACHLRASDPKQAIGVIHRSLSVRRRSRDRWSIALGLYVLGLLLERRGLLRGARRRFEESLILRRRLGIDPDGALDCLEGMTRVALHTGAMQDARRHCTEALALAQRLGNRIKIGLAHTRFMEIHLLTGAPTEAHAWRAEVLSLAEDIRNHPWSSHLHVLGGLSALDLGDAEEAGWCLELALADASREAKGPSAAAVHDGWPSGWSEAWRDLLVARLDMKRDDGAARRQAPGASLRTALLEALASRHEPLIAEILSVWVELYSRDGRKTEAAHLAAELLACPVLCERRRVDLHMILGTMMEAPDTTPMGDEAPGPGALPSAPPTPLPAASLLTLADEVLAEDRPGG
jgi:DNA-binding SARP family transcriptional activator/predicted ATPase